MVRKPHLIVQPRLPLPPMALTLHRFLSDHPAVSSLRSAALRPFQELVQHEMQIPSVNVYGELSVASGPGL